MRHLRHRLAFAWALVLLMSSAAFAVHLSSPEAPARPDLMLEAHQSPPQAP
jgi:hypothetical protein